MCDPATAALILTAVSTGTEAVNQNQALRRQDKQAAEGIRRQGLIQSGASKRIDEQIEDFRTSTGESERGESLQGFLNALQVSRDDTEGALDPVLAANPRFAERVSGGKERIATAGKEQSGRLSRIDSPLFQRQAEAGRVSRTVGDVNELTRQSTIEDFLTRLRVAEERPNALISALTKIGQGTGSALSLGAGSATGPSIIGEAGIPIGGSGAVGPFLNTTNPLFIPAPG